MFRFFTMFSQEQEFYNVDPGTQTKNINKVRSFRKYISKTFLATVDRFFKFSQLTNRTLVTTKQGHGASIGEERGLDAQYEAKLIDNKLYLSMDLEFWPYVMQNII
jgi:hypothetical protein